MWHLRSQPLLRVLGFLLLAVPPAALAQSKTAPPPTEPGWGSTWLQPANEPQRKQRELLARINAARKIHDTNAALAACEQLIVLTPVSSGPYAVRATIHDEAHRFDLALADLDRAQEIARKEDRPTVTASLLRQRARVHAHQKDYPAAINDLQASLKLDRENVHTLNGLAWLRATAPDAAVRNGPEAVRLAQKAVPLATENTHATIDTLAAAYAEANDFSRAVDSENRALAIAGKEIKDAAKAQKFQQEATGRLRLFEQHQAYHADLP